MKLVEVRNKDRAIEVKKQTQQIVLKTIRTSKYYRKILIRIIFHSI